MASPTASSSSSSEALLRWRHRSTTTSGGSRRWHGWPRSSARPRRSPLDSEAAQVRLYEAVAELIRHTAGARPAVALRRRRTLGRRVVAGLPRVPRAPASRPSGAPRRELAPRGGARRSSGAAPRRRRAADGPGERDRARSPVRRRCDATRRLHRPRRRARCAALPGERWPPLLRRRVPRRARRAATTSRTGRCPSACETCSSAASPASASSPARCSLRPPCSAGRSTPTRCARRAAEPTRRSSSRWRSSLPAACSSRERTAPSTSGTSRRATSSARACRSRAGVSSTVVPPPSSTAGAIARTRRRSPPSTSLRPGTMPPRRSVTASPAIMRGACSRTPRRSATIAPRSHSGSTDATALHEAIGDLETLAGNYGAAFASYETAAALAAPDALPAIERRIGLLHLRRGEWELAEASLRAASEGLDPAHRSLATADRALARTSDGRRGCGERAGRSMPSRWPKAPVTTRALAQAHNVAGMLAGSRGDDDEAVAQLELGVAIAHAAGDAGAETAALNNLALAVAVVRRSGARDRADDGRARPLRPAGRPSSRGRAAQQSCGSPP